MAPKTGPDKASKVVRPDKLKTATDSVLIGASTIPAIALNHQHLTESGQVVRQVVRNCPLAVRTDNPPL